MRKGETPPEQNSPTLASVEAIKQRHFEFMHKVKEGQAQPQGEGGRLLTGAKSLNNLHTFSGNPLFKKQEVNPQKGHADVRCPEESSPETTPVKSEGRFPGFEFKKKKAGEGHELNTPRPTGQRARREIKLEDFELLDKLGKGAFGEVFMAQEKHTGFICVIKKMSKKRIRERQVEEHVLREIKIQFYLSHPLLTALFGCFHDAEHIYLILEALPDGSLQQVKRKRKLPEKEAAGIVSQVSQGLKSMHEDCIIHRDLKP